MKGSGEMVVDRHFNLPEWQIQDWKTNSIRETLGKEEKDGEAR